MLQLIGREQSEKIGGCFMKNVIRVFLVGILFFALVPVTAQAAMHYSNFDLYLPGLNGYASTGYVQKKAESGATGEIIVDKKSSSQHVFDARMEDKGGQKGAWTRQIGSGSALLKGHSQHFRNEKIKLGLSSNWNAVGQYYSGKWMVLRQYLGHDLREFLNETWTRFEASRFR